MSWAALTPVLDEFARYGYLPQGSPYGVGARPREGLRSRGESVLHELCHGIFLGLGRRVIDGSEDIAQRLRTWTAREADHHEMKVCACEVQVARRYGCNIALTRLLEYAIGNFSYYRRQDFSEVRRKIVTYQQHEHVRRAVRQTVRAIEAVRHEMGERDVSTKSFKFSDKLFLVRQPTGRAVKPAKPVEQPTNHIVIIDCSGSMTGDLPQVREHLKSKLPKLLGPKDTVTLIWFSGRGQFGWLVKAEPVATLTDLQAIHKAIDRWLIPIGLTGFKEPLEEADRIIDEVRKKTKDGVFSLFFMSDGCDNEWRDRSVVMKAVEVVSAKCAASTFVEYGYYADRPFLASMAERAGGAHIFAETFPKYEPIFAAAMQKKIVGGKRIEVEIEGDPICGFAYAMDDGDLLTFAIEGGKILVPEHIDDVWYLNPQKAGAVADEFTGKKALPLAGLASTEEEKTNTAIYAALSLFAVRMKPDVIYPILKGIGDVAFIEQFGGCFGKQRYSKFMEDAKIAAFVKTWRYTKGWDPKKIPDDDAFTLLELLRMLSADEDARVLFNHPAWRYSRIGRARVDAEDNLTDSDRYLLVVMTAQLGEAKSVTDAKEIQGKIDAFLASKRDALKFVANPEPDGYSIATLTYNEKSPNISILIKKEGTVDLSARIAAAGGVKGLSKLPSAFPTYIWRNYAIVKHGLVNVEKLVVKLAPETAKAIQAKGVEVSSEGPGDGVYIINLASLPIINRRMVQTSSAIKMFELEWKLTEKKAAQKVWNYYRKTLFPKESEGYKLVYGEDAAAWLDEQGLTDYGGFAPKMVMAVARDFYMGKEMEVELKGFKSLPTVENVKERMEKAKGPKGKPLTGGAALMAPAIEEAEAFLAANDKEGIRKGFLEGKQKLTTAETRSFILQKAQQVFTIIVGQTWFQEWKTIDEKTLNVGTSQGDVLGTIEMSEIKIEI